jgi:hypothetical protein
MFFSQIFLALYKWQWIIMLEKFAVSLSPHPADPVNSVRAREYGGKSINDKKQPRIM